MAKDKELLSASMSKVGSWAFLIGFVLAILFGLFGAMAGSATAEWLAILLFVIGIVVGFFNISDKEVTPFLMSGAVLVVVAFFGKQTIVVPMVDSVLKALLILFVPATLIVAIKNVFALARN